LKKIKANLDQKFKFSYKERMTMKSLRTPRRSEILSNRADSFFYSLKRV
jgi:hypothetical protein